MAYLSVILASLFWSFASQIFSFLGHHTSVAKINLYKMLFSLMFFLPCVLVLSLPLPNPSTFILLFLSSFFGLYLADYFLFSSFTFLGPAKTQMIACFGPSYLVALSFIFLNLSLTTFDLLGIFFLTCSIFIMGYAHSKQSSPSTSPSWRYFLYAFFGTFLDSLGVFFSKMAFMHTKELHPLSVGFFRVLFSFLLLSATFRWIFRSPLSLELHSRHRRLLILASFCGTFLTLAFYNYALSKEHPAIVAALGSLAPLYSSLYESWRDKKPLSWSLIFSLLLMLIGIGFSTHAFSLLFS